MLSIIIGTHGRFSEELLRSSEMIYGKQENVATVTFEVGEGIENLLEKYYKALKALDCSEGVLFMVDLFGGSPFNAASSIAFANNHMDMVTGVNLPMLLEVYSMRKVTNLEEIVIKIEQVGKESIKAYKNMLGKACEEEL